MNLRDLKLAIACCEESDEVKSLNNFFDDLFSGLTIYTTDNEPDLIFMKNGKFVMQQDLKNSYLWCRYMGFWSVLQTIYHCNDAEIKELIQYKVEEAYKIGSLTPVVSNGVLCSVVEETYKIGSLTPVVVWLSQRWKVEESYKIGSLTPLNSCFKNTFMVEEVFKNGSLTQLVK